VSGQAAPKAVPKGAWYALVLMGLMQAVSLLDRQILAILAPAIKADLKVGDAEMGLLSGTVFALFYALFSLPLGRLADGWSRNKLLAISLLLWSGATALGGMASSFAMLVFARLGVGIGEAASQPAGTSLIYDYWPKERRGFVMSVLAAAISLGIGGSLIVGGLAADWWTTSYPASSLKGWQFAFLAAASPGFVLAILIWLLREPVRGEIDGIVAPPDPHPFLAARQVLASVTPGFNWLNLKRQGAAGAMWRDNLLWLGGIVLAMFGLIRLTQHYAPRPSLAFGMVAIDPHVLQWSVIGFGLFALVNLIQNLKLTDASAYRVITGSPTLIAAMAVGALQSVINYGMMFFNPSFLMRYYELPMRDAAWQFGLVAASMGFLGPLLWGPLSDRLNLRFPGAGRAWVSLFAMGVSPLMSFWVYHAPDAGSFYLRFIPYSLVLTGWLPPLYAIIYDQVLPRMRGITASVYLLVGTIVGLGLGPYVVGMLSEATGDLRTAMLSINAVAIPIVLLMLLVARRADRDESSLLARAAG
jgi:MFS family permease